MSKIDTVIFDLGGVLVDWNPEHLYLKAFNGDTKKMNWFLTNVCTPEWNMEQDAGRTIAEAEKIKIAEYPQYEELIKLFYKDWEFMFKGVIKENVELFKRLKASENYKVYALTNWSAEKWDKALELFPFFKDFDGVVVSGQEKCRKPFDKIYKIIIDRFNISPEKAIFIDDNFDNAQSAKRLGINGIHFKNIKQLNTDLASFNIL
ncbi:2-haloacid dehalogenase [Lutibacter oricola]|uniref:2-haloacid dehalogenase n=1 Tax=Lutibacter oricola TaxID=762486 RepID=A0A1H2VY90_9FLAO|nr:HAD family phosphatase [Lutibacter oricola]SDW73315.1 2-haloacid dehalogenase [Lutibacter oricola]